MWEKVRGVVITPTRSSRRRPGPIRRVGDWRARCELPLVVLPLAVKIQIGVYGSRPSPGRRWREVESWHRKPQRLAAVRHVDRGKADRAKAAAAAIALFVDFKFALAGAELRGPAPVQRSVLDADRAVFSVDCFGEAEHLLRLAGDVGMQAFAGIDAVPAAAGDGLAVVGGDLGHDLARRVVT